MENQALRDNRWSATNPPPKQKGHPGPYFIPILRKFLEKKIKFEDPETQQIIQGQVKHAIIWRLLLNAAQGENEAIKMVLERLDGKAVQKLIGEGFGGGTKVIIVREKKDDPKKDNNRLPEVPEKISG